MKVKAWWESTTIWFNVLWLLGVVAGLFGYAEFQPSPEVTQLGTILALVIPLIVNIIKRIKTDSMIVK